MTARWEPPHWIQSWPSPTRGFLPSLAGLPPKRVDQAEDFLAPRLAIRFGRRNTLAAGLAIQTHRTCLVGGEPTAQEAVSRILATAAERLTQPGLPSGCLLINGATNYAARSADVAAGLMDKRNQARGMIESRIKADRDSGVLPSSVDAHSMATYVVAVWHGMAQLARDGATRSDLQEAVEIAMSVWSR